MASENTDEENSTWDYKGIAWDLAKRNIEPSYKSIQKIIPVTIKIGRSSIYRSLNEIRTLYEEYKGIIAEQKKISMELFNEAVAHPIESPHLPYEKSTLRIYDGSREKYFPNDLMSDEQWKSYINHVYEEIPNNYDFGDMNCDQFGYSSEDHAAIVAAVKENYPELLDVLLDGEDLNVHFLEALSKINSDPDDFIIHNSEWVHNVAQELGTFFVSSSP